MSYLHNNNSEYIAARVTSRGRRKIAEGNFNISYFQIGDSEFDYYFSEYTGTNDVTNPPQKIFAPLDKDDIVKYPYKLSESTITGTTYGNPIQSAYVETIKNNIGPAGFVSQYLPYTGGTGSTIVCAVSEVDLAVVDGTNALVVSSGATFTNCGYITMAFTTLVGYEMLSGSSNSLTYKIVSISGNTLNLDRNMPDLSSLSGQSISIICHDCTPASGATICDANTGQQDPWTLNIVWDKKPTGLDVPTEIDERLSGYTSNIYSSTKEFFGYNSSSGQTENTGTTVANSFGVEIAVEPEDQHSIGILHYSEISTIDEPDKFFKYEDYIAHTEKEDREYFQVYIPFLLYNRNTGTTIGAVFHMGDTDYYINSSASDTKRNKIKYRYLLDEQNYKVGKIFVNHKTVIFDDEEIVSALDYKSNRRYTLPIPAVAQVPTDLKCDIGSSSSDPLMSGTTGETIYVSYLLAMTGNTGMTGLHCNHYGKVTGTTLNSDISVKFDDDDFTYMGSSLSDFLTGYVADNFSILVQKVNTGEQPLPDGWKIIDFTSEIPGHTPGNYIDPANLRDSRFVVTQDQYTGASYYDLEDYLGEQPDEPSTDPQFGDEQPFPGSIKLTRAIDLQVMRFLINLPEGEFEVTQNPSWSSGKSKRITEIALLDSNKDILVIGKTPKPIERIGTQVLAVKIDF